MLVSAKPYLVLTLDKDTDDKTITLWPSGLSALSAATFCGMLQEQGCKAISGVDRSVAGLTARLLQWALYIQLVDTGQ